MSVDLNILAKVGKSVFFFLFSACCPDLEDSVHPFSVHLDYESLLVLHSQIFHPLVP